MPGTATVSVTSDLPIPPDVVAGLVAKPALLRHVLWPVIIFPDLPGRYDLECGVTVRLNLLGVVPLWRHTIRVLHAEPDAGVAITEERGGPVRLWRHRLSAEPLDTGGCRYTDKVEIDAGALTGAPASSPAGSTATGIAAGPRSPACWRDPSELAGEDCARPIPSLVR